MTHGAISQGSPVLRPAGRILVVEDDDLVLQTLASSVRANKWEPCAVMTVHDALVALRDRVDGCIIDLRLNDGSGFDVIVEARRREPDVPVLVLTGLLDPVTVNRANRLTVEFAAKPMEADLVPRFLRRCRTSVRKRLADMITDLVIPHRLTNAHGRIIYVAVMKSTKRDVIAAELGLSPNTIKTQISDIVEALGAECLEDIARPLRSIILQRVN